VFASSKTLVEDFPPQSWDINILENVGVFSIARCRAGGAHAVTVGGSIPLRPEMQWTSTPSTP